jgi:cytochrome c peroxidase
VPTNYTATRLFDINLLNRDFFIKYPDSEITEAERELGRVLFYDPALSFNNSMACVSCHHPDKAFTDGVPKSISNDQSTEVERNAPTLVNALFAGAYFHDLRAGKLTMQTEHVMANPKEFNVRPLELTEKLNKSAAYKALFKSAYPGLKEPIQPRTIQSALASYVASLVSWNSPFDRYARGEADTIDPEVVKGYNLFMGKAACGTCHFAPNFSGLVPPFYDDTESEVLGVPFSNDTIHPVLDHDLGRIKNGKRSEEAEHFRHSFKTPTVRNIALTAPYFHNGAYPTLEEVMWFYNKGGGQGLGIDIPNQTLPPDALGLTKGEISAIIAFMNSLTDIDAFIKAPPALPAFEDDPALKNRTAYSY